MKHLHTLLIVAALLAAGCASPEEFPADPTPGGGGIRVEFSVDIPANMETDWEHRPMTRVTSYKTRIANQLRYVVLKKIDTRWIVDQADKMTLDTAIPAYSNIDITDNFPPHTISLEVRPGQYKMVAIVNPTKGRWYDLVPGTVVADESDPSFQTPPLMTYLLSDHDSNAGYLTLYGEVFVAVHDFTVPKSEDLHSAGMPPIKLHADRRVGKFRLLLKDKASPQEKFTFKVTDHKAHLLFTPKGRPLPNGIDALGNTYYDPAQPLSELPWCMSTSMNFYSSGGNKYQLSQTNATVMTPFLFMDPERGDIDFTVSITAITGANGMDGFSYRCRDTFARTLGANKTTGIVFQTTDAYEGVRGEHPTVEIVEATNEDGQPENAAAIFDEFFEWNAASYNNK